MREILVAPSILSADFGRLAEDVVRAEEAGADWIHVDVMDGHFVPNLTIGPAVTAAVRRATRLPVDVHLMIENPDRYVGAFADAGADWITVHQEAAPHLHRVLTRIRESGAKAGVALNPSTPVDTVRDVIGELDLLLVMSVNPGFGGQRFIDRSVARVRRARDLVDAATRANGGPDAAGTGGGIRIQVDGGVDRSTARSVVEAGADVLVAGSAVYGHPDGVEAGITEIRTAAGRGD